MTDVLRTFHTPVIRDAAQSKQFLIEVGRESFDPFLQLFRYEGFQNFCQCVSGTVGLIASCFVNQSDDSDSGKPSDEYFTLFGDMYLLVVKLPGLSRSQHY